MLSELPSDYYEAIKRQDEDGDPRSLPLTSLEKERRTYSNDVVEKFNRLPPQQKRGGIGQAVTSGLVSSATPFRTRPVILQVGGRNVLLKVDPNNKMHPADQLGGQIERSGLFTPANQQNGYVQLYLREKDGQPRRPLSDLGWRDALREVTDNAVGPYNKAKHVGVTINYSLPKRISTDPNATVLVTPGDPAAEQEEGETAIPINIETDGMAKPDDLLSAIVHEIAKNTASAVISQHDEQNPDWRPTLETLSDNPVLVRRIVVRSLHKAKHIAFPNATPHAAFAKVGCHDPCAGINTFSTMLTNCLASNCCAPPPALCNRRLVRCFEPCKLKRYLCEKIRCALRAPILAWAASCVHSLRARAKRFLSCYKDCRENCCALRPVEHCPDGAVNQDDCVQIKTICSDSDSDSGSGSDSDSSSNSDSEQLQGLSAMDTLHMRQLRKQRRHLSRTKRRIMRQFCPSCHCKRSDCSCKRFRARSSFCRREQPISAFDALCPVQRGPYDCPLLSICEPIAAEMDPRAWRRRAGMHPIPSTPNHPYEAPTTAPGASTQPSASPATQPGEDVEPEAGTPPRAARRLDFGEEESDGEERSYDGEDGELANWNDEEDEDGALIEGKYGRMIKKKGAKAKSALVSMATGQKAPLKPRRVPIKAILTDSNPEKVQQTVLVWTTRDEKYIKSPLYMSTKEYSTLAGWQGNKAGNVEKTETFLNIIERRQPKSDLIQSLFIGAEEAGEPAKQVKFEEEEEEEEEEEDNFDLAPMEDDDFEDEKKQATAAIVNSIQKNGPVIDVFTDLDELHKKNRRQEPRKSIKGRVRRGVGDAISSGFELNSVEHARYATAENEAEIHAALKSALARTGKPIDHAIVNAVIELNRAQTKHVAKHIAASYDASELADEEHIGWAMGRYWAAHLNRRRILAWNKFAEWYNSRSCDRKLCLLPVPPCPVKPDPCKPCEAAADPCGAVDGKCKLEADPCSSDSVSDEEEKKEQQGKREKKTGQQQQQEEVEVSSDEEEVELNAAPIRMSFGKNDDDDDDDKEIEKRYNLYSKANGLDDGGIGAQSSASSNSTPDEDAEIASWFAHELDEAEALGDKKKEAKVWGELDEMNYKWADDSDEEEKEEATQASIRARISAAKARASQAVAASSSSAPQQASIRGEITADKGKTKEEATQASIRARIEAAKACASQAVAASSSSSLTLAPHKFKVDNFVRVMRDTGAINAFNNYSSPDIDAHIVALHDEHPAQQRLLEGLKKTQGNKSAQRALLAPLTVFVPRRADGTMQPMNNVNAPARDNKNFYKFQNGSELINGQPAGPPIDIRTGARPASYSKAVKLVYPVADFSH